MSKLATGRSGRAPTDGAAGFLQMLNDLQTDLGRGLAPVLHARHGIDLRLYFLLHHVGSGAVHPGNIARAVRLPNSVITRHMDQLVDRGLVERGSDAVDSRRVTLSLTADGRRIAREAGRTVAAIVDARLARLAPARRAAFLAAFAALVRGE